MKKLFWMVLILVLAGCTSVREDPTGTVLPLTLSSPTAQIAELPPVVTEKATQPCGYQWAYQSLPEISAQFQQVFESAGMTGITVRAEAFGENCLNADGSVQRFLPMQTDLYLVAMVPDLAPETMGSQVEQIFTIIQQIPTESLPGPGSASAYLTFEFIANQEIIRFRVQRSQVEQALLTGQHGMALYEALVP